MFCPNCGATVPDDAITCESCGTRLVIEESPPDLPPTPTLPPSPAPAPVYAGPLPETSGLAIVSMVLGLVSLLAGGGMLLVPGVLALVLGYMARNQIRESGGRLRGDEFAIVGMVTGGISLAIGLVICLMFVLGMIMYGSCMCLPLCMLPFMAIPTATPTW